MHIVRNNTVKMMAAVLKKNFIEYIRYPVNAFFWLFMPVIWVLPTYFLIISFAPGGVSPGLLSWTGSDDFHGYFIIGLLISHVIMTIFWSIGFSLKRLMDIGMLETVWIMPASRITYIMAESLFSMIRMIYELIVLLLIFRFLFRMSLPAGFLSILPWFIPFAVLMYGFGIGFAAIVLLAKDANMLVDTLSFLTQTLTGTQNPPQVFPKLVLVVSMAIPITFFIDFVRHRSMGIIPLLPADTELFIIVASAVLMPILGIWIFRRVDKRCRIKGNIHAH